MHAAFLAARARLTEIVGHANFALARQREQRARAREASVVRRARGGREERERHREQQEGCQLCYEKMRAGHGARPRVGGQCVTLGRTGPVTQVALYPHEGTGGSIGHGNEVLIDDASRRDLAWVSAQVVKRVSSGTTR